MPLDTRTAALLAALGAVASAGLGYFVTRQLARASPAPRHSRSSHTRQPLAMASAEHRAPVEANGIRPAGPEAMRDPPPDWDAVDEADDQSFPASDPPATY